MKARPFILLVIMLIAGSYIHGARIVNLSELPSSKRPWPLYLSAEYQQQHLTPAD